jgi:site-specific DNA-cytosine methylase
MRSSGARRRLSVGTDCSGLEAPLVALRRLGMSFRHEFSSELCSTARRVLRANFRPRRLFRDLTSRSISETPRVDLYVAGFPCQAFSTQGQQQGFCDERGRGVIYYYLRRYIKVKRPKAFVLENVKGLLQIQGGACFRAIWDDLQSLRDYKVFWKVLNAEDFGIPQHRPRVFFVGIRRDSIVRKFRFPTGPGRQSLESFLLPRRRAPTWEDLPSTTTARDNVLRRLCELQAQGLHPFEELFVFNCDAATDRCHAMKDRSPCLTRARFRGHWLSNRGRYMHLLELVRLQGFGAMGRL